MKFSILISVGKWARPHFRNSKTTKGVCLGWISLNFHPLDMEETLVNLVNERKYYEDIATQHEKQYLTFHEELKADDYLRKHIDHIFHIIEGEKLVHRPSTEDKNHPSLWKSCHWNWFIRWYVKEE